MANAAPQAEDKIAVENGRLVVNVALTGGVPSKSGKSMVFFTTNGLMPMDDGYTIGINLIRKRAGN